MYQPSTGGGLQTSSQGWTEGGGAWREALRSSPLGLVAGGLRGTLGSSLRSPAEGEGNEGFPPAPDKDLERGPNSQGKAKPNGQVYAL